MMQLNVEIYSMSDTDYYKTLGLDKSASEDQIKKAYRKLAMKYHPDQTKGNKAAEEKFKKISEAYAVLSDKEKRKQYDTFGSAGFQQRYSKEDIFRGFDFGNIFREFGFGNSDPFSGGGPGGFRFSSGNGSQRFNRGRQSQAQLKGSDIVYELPLTLQEIATGVEKTISLQHTGNGEKVSVKIPKGMLSGKKIRLVGKGEASRFGGPSGDLFIQSKALNNPEFSVEEHDLHVVREIKLSEAILGTIVSVPTIDGKALNLTIPKGTKHKTKMRLPDHGLPHMRGKKKGNLYVNIHVNMPKDLSDKQKALIEKLAKTGL